MTTHTAPPPRLDTSDPTAPQPLAALTVTRLLHQRVLLLDRELEQDNGS